MTRTAIENEQFTLWLKERDEQDRIELRDEFAKIALAAVLPASGNWPADSANPELIAVNCYRWADRMLAARDGKA